MMSPAFLKSLLLSGLLILSGLFTGCSEDSPVVEEIEDEPQLPVTYSVEVKDGRSDMPPGGGVITAEFSDFTTGCDVGKMADKKPETNYEIPKSRFYILWTGSKSALVNQYALTAASDAPESDPKSWSLSGSNDKRQWTLLDEQNNQQFSARGAVKEYAIDNETEYRFYKLEVKDNQGAETTQIAEWALQRYSVEVDEGLSEMPPGGGVITPQYAFYTPGFDVGQLVDGDTETKYATPYDSFYLLWSSSERSIVNHYSLTAADDLPDSDPSSWILYGSINGEVWVLLDEQNDQQFTTRGETKEYMLENEIAFSDYKLEIKANQGASSTQIAEWTLKDVTVVVSDGVANMPPGEGVIRPQYAAFADDNDVGKMVDSDPATMYATPYSSFYVLWSNSDPALVNNYSLTAAVDRPENDPRSWSLYGSNDKDSWDLLDAQHEQQFTARGEVKEYSIDNETEYSYFKLVIEENWGGASTQIAEWGMQEIYTDIDELMQYASGSSYSSLTPMGNHYANRHVTTDEDRLWLSDPSNESPAPGSASHLSLAEFPVTLYPYGDPLPADVNQHSIGDCGGVAAMASLAYVYPDFVKTLIKDNGDKSYTVSMFDPQGEPVEVTVTNRFLTGNGTIIDAVSGKSNTATWSTVLEKAIMKYNVVYQVNPDIGGIGSEHVIPLFTGDGNSFAFSPGKLSNRELKRVVQVCLMQGKLIIGGFNKGGLTVDNSETVTAHAYTLMHSTDRSALFAMRNPWGGNPKVDGTADGVLNIPDNTLVPPTIDFRIVDPGKAANYGDGVTEPYIPPTLRSTDLQMRVASYLLNPAASVRD